MKASVILPVYNGEKYLAAAIESVLDQSYRNFELLIIDDGSTDGSVEIIRQYSDPRITLKTQDNAGLGITLNRLVSLCESDIIIRMDADDICEPHRIERQLCYLKEKPDCVMVGGQIRFLVENKTIFAGHMPQDHGSIVSGLEKMRFPICHPAIAFRKHAFSQAGGYRVIGAGEDMDFFLRMSEVGKLANISEIVLMYRMHLTSLSTTRQNELYLNYSHAIYCHLRRLAGQTEPSRPEYFARLTGKRYLSYKIGSTNHAISERLYRKSIIERAMNHRVRSGFYLALTALLRPRSALRRLIELFRP